MTDAENMRAQLEQFGPKLAKRWVDHLEDVRTFPLDVETDDGSPGPVHITVVDKRHFDAALEVARWASDQIAAEGAQ